MIQGSMNTTHPMSAMEDRIARARAERRTPHRPRRTPDLLCGLFIYPEACSSPTCGLFIDDLKGSYRLRRLRARAFTLRIARVWDRGLSLPLPVTYSAQRRLPHL